MRLPTMVVMIALALLVSAAVVVTAHEDDGFDHMHDDDHMGGWWQMPGMGPMVYGYWLLAIPIGLLIYVDATRRELNGAMWFLLVLIPWAGLLAAAAYLGARSQVVHRPEPTYGDPYYLPNQRRNGGW